MTRQDIRDALIALRFDANLSDHMNAWINAKEGEIWQYCDWPVKNTQTVSLTVTNGAITLPAIGAAGYNFVEQNIRIFDSNGFPLRYMNQDDFFDVRQQLTSGSVSTTDSPSAWTFASATSGSGTNVTITPQILVSPTFTGTLNSIGWTTPIHRTDASTFALGTMSDDSHIPWWPDDYHYFLVFGAAALGSNLLGGLDAPGLNQEFTAGLERLKNELMPARRDTIEQWSGEYDTELWAR